MADQIITTVWRVIQHPDAWTLLAAAPDLRQSLADVLTLARIKWGNLDPDANKIFERAEALLASMKELPHAN